MSGPVIPIHLDLEKTGRMTPRPYQVEAANAAIRELNLGDSTLVVMPTGTGKTVTFADIALKWPHELGRVMVIGHRTELIDQAAEKIETHTGEPCAIERAQDRDVRFMDGTTHKCLVASIQTLCAPGRLAKMFPKEFGLIVVDEAHHATAATYRKVLEYFRGLNPDLRTIGVTATPERADGIGLGHLFRSVAYHMPLLRAIEDGWLVDVQQTFVTVDSLSLELVRTTAGDLSERDLERALFEITGDDDPDVKLSDDLCKITEEEDPEEALKVARAVMMMVKPGLDISAGRQTLSFSPTVKHARVTQHLLKAMGVKCEMVHGGTDPVMRKDAIRDFRARKIQVLCGCGVFTEGFDAPECEVIWMMRLTKSKSLYTQVIGRATRPLPGLVDGPSALTSDQRCTNISQSRKPHCTVVDFCGNSGRHRLVTAYDILAGDAPEALVNELIADAKKKPGTTCRAEIEQKKAEHAERERKRREANDRRSKLKADAKFQSTDVNPFTGETHTQTEPGVRLTDKLSDKQLRYLIYLGVSRDTAKAYTKRQASAVISKLKAKAAEPQFEISNLKSQMERSDLDVNSQLQLWRTMDDV